MMIKGLTQLMFALLATIAIIIVVGDAQQQRQHKPTPAEKPWHHTTPTEDRQWQLDRLAECMNDNRLCGNETP